MFILRFLRFNALWAAAITLVLVPFVVAADMGGILRWTQLIAGIAIVVATLLSCAGLFGRDPSAGLRQHVLLIPLMLWLG
ncbi:MAG: hypothetical protein HKN47_28420, partial [Pirellulaceae bacterium]|nr:hypothetical protein [Pirellulaceae bacterium]